MTMHLENSEEMLTFAPDDESQKRLVVRHRVFFDANYSRLQRHTSTFSWKNVDIRTVSKS